MEPTLEKVSPDIASHLLSINPRWNRYIKGDEVSTLSKVMSDGFWDKNSQALILGKGDCVFTGHNLLAAIIDSGNTVELLVYRDQLIDPEDDIAHYFI
jgi:hypothetical protein